jgi:pre-mRNA-processing factor SLU7
MWGYACCHSSVHVSYCAGQAGIDAAKASSASQLLSASDAPMPPPPVPAKARAEADEEEDGEDRRRRAEAAYSKKRVGEGDVSIDKARLDKALSEEKKRKAMRGEEDEWGSGKRRKGGREGDSYDVSEEDMGTYISVLSFNLLTMLSQRHTG